jgi:hypothetical protein
LSKIEKEKVFIMNASYEEKTVWITFVSLFLVFSGYVATASQMLVAGETAATPFLPIIAQTILVLVIIVAVASSVVAIISRPDGRDERDRLIEWKAEATACKALELFALAAIIATAFPAPPAWIANGLLLGMFIQEFIKCGLQIHYYRNGM